MVQLAEAGAGTQRTPLDEEAPDGLEGLQLPILPQLVERLHDRAV